MQPILNRMLELAPRDRGAWLEKACAGDLQLRADVEKVLAADAEAGGVLDAPTGGFIEWFVEEARQQSTLTTPRQPAAPLDAGLIARQVLARHSRARAAGRTPYSDPPVGTAGATARFLPGAMLASRYRVVALLGRGGMGEVYRADDLKLGQGVALKFLPASVQNDPAHLERLLNEVRLARQVSHPNVCRVYDVGETEGRHFISMEYVDGEDLSSLLKRIGRLPAEKALRIAQQLCAGLAAAHEQGILHRDLKPANVMLDGRGRVRIADFGLAAGAVVQGREAREGTKAYMAPEQLAGLEATRRSDLYALGLVLYEVFTGRRAFQADSEQELRRLQEESSPARPSSLVEGIGAEVERTILQCLEKDPALRPSSALAVAAMMPGGDPLAAALAAGETPSPEMVALAGPRGAVTPRTAGLLLAGFGVGLAGVLLLADQTLLLNRVPQPKPMAALVDDAREIALRLGYDVTGWSSFSGSELNWGGLFWHSEELDGPRRWDFLTDPNAWIYGTKHRFSPRLLVPTNLLGGSPSLLDFTPRWDDLMIATDTQGRLRFFMAFASPSASAADDIAPPPWGRLFELAGLDATAFREVPPTLQPEVPSDARAAWSGTWPDGSGLPVRLEAATLRSRPVFFEAVFPYDAYWDTNSVVSLDPPIPDKFYVAYLLWSLFLVSVAACSGWLLARNLRTGRGDRRGALRLALVVLSLYIGWWVLMGHHVPSLWGEVTSVLTALRGSLLAAAIIWVLYIVLEPEVRRVRPDALVSWARLLTGRWRDPLVGRDLLIGMAAGPLVVLLADQLYVALPPLMGSQTPPFPEPFPLVGAFFGPITPALVETSWIFAGGFAVAITSINVGLAFSVFYFLLCRILRSRVAACGVYLLFAAFTQWTATLSDYSPLGIVLTLAWVGLTLLLLDRVGTLCYFGAIAGSVTYHTYPFTMDPARTYFPVALAAVAGLAALALLAAAIACGRLAPGRTRSAEAA